MLRDYYRLAKPGIVYGNTMTTLAAFLFASRWIFSLGLFLSTILGIALVIGSACVFNNYLDREFDARMARTKDRALATGRIRGTHALIYGALLGCIGFALLFFFVNALTGCMALVGFISYVFFYTFSKRLGSWSTLVGSISGAMPIVVGYTAVANRLDAVALILFLILVSWQMPHFYAIALRRMDEYAAANLPILPLVYGAWKTKMDIVLYIVTYLLAVSALAISGHAGYAYLALVLVPGLAWLALALKGFRKVDRERWARRVFLCSLVVLLLFSAALSVASLLP